MKVAFKDLQQSENPLNGKTFESAADVTDTLKTLDDRKPFLFELRGDNGSMLTIGFAGNLGSVQYSLSDGSPPYLIAVSDEETEEGKFVEFLAGNTPTPISRRFCLPIRLVERIVREFIERGEKSGAVNWEEI